MLTSQNMWSPYTFYQTTYCNPPPPYPSGSWSYSKPKGDPTTPWLKWPVALNTPLHMLKWSDTAAATCNEPSWKSTNGPSWPKSSEKMRPFQVLNTVWRCMASMNNSPTSKATWTSTGNSQSKTMPHATQTHVATTTVDQEVHPEEEVMLPPEQAAKLLLWYMQWSHDLVAEMHCRHQVWHQACRTVTPSSSCDCSCNTDWQCEPHNVCFIHDSCFCPGSGSFPPNKPPHTFLSPHDS